MPTAAASRTSQTRTDPPARARKSPPRISRTASRGSRTASRSPATAFAQDGFFVAKGLFADRIPALERSFDRIVAQISGAGENTNARWGGAASDQVNGASRRVVTHTHNVQMYDALWATLWYEPSFLDLCRAFLGPNLALHHTKLFQKPAERGAAFPMHQDWGYFPVEGDRCLAAIVHVSRADAAMGCLRIVPGSHRDGRIVDAKGDGDLTELQRRHPLETATPVLCQPGDVVFFHCLTVHGSGVNTHPRDVRKTVLAQVYDATAEPLPGPHHYDSRFLLCGTNPRMTRSKAGQ